MTTTDDKELIDELERLDPDSDGWIAVPRDLVRRCRDALRRRDGDCNRTHVDHDGPCDGFGPGWRCSLCSGLIDRKDGTIVTEDGSVEWVRRREADAGDVAECGTSHPGRDCSGKATPTPREAVDVEAVCKAMHHAYEETAAAVGWETHVASRVPWADVPEPNKAAMRAAAHAALSMIALSHPPHDTKEK